MEMNTETYKLTKDEVQTLTIAELLRRNSHLSEKLRHARHELGEQRTDLARLRDGKLALRLELAGANSEIGRLVTALTHDTDREKDAPATVK